MRKALKVLCGVLFVITAFSLLLYNNSVFSAIYLPLDNEESSRESSSESSSFLNRLEGPLIAEDPQLVSYVYSNFLKPPSTKPYNLIFPRDFNKEKPFLGGIRFYEFLYDTFKDIDRPGFFIEAGALDGQTGSNTLWLEYRKNWTGLLIEPGETSCKALEAKNRRAWTSCSCISPHKYAIKTVFEIPHSKIPKKFWLFNANIRSINSRFHTYEDIIMKAVKQKKGSFTYATAQCFPLITYLLALNVTEVDLLSLDTQGGEKNMLFNFPFDKVRVNYMLIEYFKRGPFPKQQDDELVSYLNSKGFDLLHMFGNSGEYIFKFRS